MTPKIRRGVSLYSFQNETFQRLMSLEECVRACAQMGAFGIEVVGEQTFSRWPEEGVPNEEVAAWRELMVRYQTVPVAHDAMLDTKRFKGRELSIEEQVSSLRGDIEFGRLLGVRYLRVLVSISPEVMVSAARFAEDAGIKLLLEVHAPFHFDHPWIVRHAEAYDRMGTDGLGFLADLGMFVHSFPRVWKDRMIREGVSLAAADYIEKAYADRVLPEYIVGNVKERFGTIDPKAVRMAEMTRHSGAFDPKRMLDHMSRIHNIHGKFYEMTESFTEDSIPYDQVIAVLKKGNYDGYICSEYEGNRWIEDVETVDSLTQVARHQAMLASLIGEEPDALHN